MEEQTLVINDLLSFLTCKLPIYSRTKLIKALRGFYSLEDIEEAHNTLLATLPDRKSTLKAHKFKHKDPLVEIYEKIKLVPENDWPLFVCKDLNNIPSFDSTETHEPSSDEDELDFDFEAEHIKMKEELKKLRSLASDLNEQLNNFLENANTNLSGSDSDMPNEEVEGSATLSQNRFLPDNSVENHSNQMNVNIIENDENFVNHIVKTEKDNSFPDEDEHVIQLSPSNSEVLESTDQLKHPTEEILYIRDKTIDTLERDSFQNDATSIQISSEGNSLKDNLKSNTVDHMNIEDSYPAEEITHTILEENSIIISIPGSNQCNVCGEIFKSKNELDWHVRTHIIEKQFNCILCNKNFNTRKNLQFHFLSCYDKTKARLKHHVCSVCGRMYGNALALKQHSSFHCKSRPFACPKCSYRFLSQKRMESHIKTIHNNLNKFPCPFCHHSYIKNGYLRAHIRTHTGEKPFQCTVCKYRASTRDILKRHMMRHGPQLEMPCKICGLVCYGIEKLNKHKLRNHRKENILCPICGKEFKNSAVYNRHYMMHTGEKPFKCPKCPYMGLTKLVLKTHMKIHSGDNLRHCPYCDVPFRTNYSLKRHLKTHESSTDI